MTMLNGAKYRIKDQNVYSAANVAGFQRVLVLAVENEFTSLVVHRRPRGHYAGVSLRCERDNFQCRIERISSSAPP